MDNLILTWISAIGIMTILTMGLAIKITAGSRERKVKLYTNLLTYSLVLIAIIIFAFTL